MLCPMKFHAKIQARADELDYDPDCNTNCSWWNERFGMCCIAIDAYQKGIEDRRRENAINRMNSPY